MDQSRSGHAVPKGIATRRRTPVVAGRLARFRHVLDRGRERFGARSGQDHRPRRDPALVRQACRADGASRLERIHVLRSDFPAVHFLGWRGHALLVLQASRTRRRHGPAALENPPPGGAAGADGTDLPGIAGRWVHLEPALPQRAGADRPGLFLRRAHYVAHVNPRPRGRHRHPLARLLGRHDVDPGARLRRGKP